LSIGNRFKKLKKPSIPRYFRIYTAFTMTWSPSGTL